jgi:hypothetical protein
MLHTLYVFAFTIIAFIAISNLIRNLISLSIESNRSYSASDKSRNNSQAVAKKVTRQQPSHPELLDESGKPINEPLLVMRSVTVEDARERLDALYKSSPGTTIDTDEEA